MMWSLNEIVMVFEIFEEGKFEESSCNGVEFLIVEVGEVLIYFCLGFC